MSKNEPILPDILFVRAIDDDEFYTAKTPIEVTKENHVTRIGVYRLEKIEKFRKLISVEKVRD